jgi:hypothetical protein
VGCSITLWVPQLSRRLGLSPPACSANAGQRDGPALEEMGPEQRELPCWRRIQFWSCVLAALLLAAVPYHRSLYQGESWLQSTCWLYSRHVLRGSLGALTAKVRGNSLPLAYSCLAGSSYLRTAPRWRDGPAAWSASRRIGLEHGPGSLTNVLSPERLAARAASHQREYASLDATASLPWLASTAHDMHQLAPLHTGAAGAMAAAAAAAAGLLGCRTMLTWSWWL